MKKLKVLIIFMTVAILTSIVLTSCGKKEEPKIEKISLESSTLNWTTPLRGCIVKLRK